MTDRELLELAAKAAGIDLSTRKWHGRWYVSIEPNTKNWNPLIDDGDALRMAVYLGIDLSFEGDNVVFADGNFSEFLSEDRCAATRRAIVRAAAEIGRSMP